MNRKILNRIKLISLVFILYCPLTNAQWLYEYKIIPDDGAPGDQFGYVDIDSNYIFVGALRNDENGIDAGAEYIYKKENLGWVLTQKLMPEDGAAGDEFGRDVDINSNYAIVGAWKDGDNGQESGSAYIYRRDGETWNQETKLLANDGAAFDNFGTRVAIYGEWAFVTAPQDDAAGPLSGSAYVFKKTETGWVQTQKLIASNAASGDKLGIGRIDMDGNYAIISTHVKYFDDYHRGCAYIFKRTGNNWQEQTILTPSGLFDNFGVCNSIFNDRIIVGAYRNNDGGYRTGAAYIFKRDDDIWTQEAKLNAIDPMGLAYFGISVKLFNNIALVGAYGTNNGTGSAYIFRYNDEAWIPQRKLNASDGMAGDWFGYYTSIFDTTLIISSCKANFEMGAAYVYTSPSFVDVELLNFTAQLNNRIVILNWITATETNNYGFFIERNVNDCWKTMGFLEGRGTSTEPHSYEFFDDVGDLQKASIQYRLKQVDYDGSFTISSALNVDISILNKYHLSQNYPNPFNPRTTIEFQLPQNLHVKLKVFNCLGQTVCTLVNKEMEAGSHTIIFDASLLSSGLYFYQIIAGNFIETKNMVVLK